MCIIAAVIILPLTYSLFYLGAFWDPYGRLNQLPVALVNEDQGAKIDGENRNLGNELVDQLKEDNSLKWIETDANSASTGVNGKEYYAVVTIPKEFSADIASAETNQKQSAKITYSANEKRNFLASQILNRAVVEMEEKLRSNVNEEITKQLVSKLNVVPSSLQDLSNGLGKLSGGSSQLSSGISSLSGGQNELFSGIEKLNNGLLKLDNGSETLSLSIYKLHEGITQIKAGISGSLSLPSGSSDQTASLGSQLQKLVTGAQTVSAGTNQASVGAAKLSEAASSTSSGIPALASGIDQTDAGANQAAKGVSDYVAGVNSLIAKNQDLASQLSSIASSSASDAQKVAAINQIVASMTSSDSQKVLKTLADSGASVKSGTAAVAAGADKLKASEQSLKSMQSNISDLSVALKQLQGGASQVAEGVSTLQAKAAGLSNLSAGLDRLNTSLNQLDNGTMQIYSGSQALTNGIKSAEAGGSQLKSGAQQLQAGASKIESGAVTLSGGIATAKDGVDQSINDASNELKATNGLSDFAKNPVSVKAEPINTVPNYGTAFAPYFMSLSLYVGALIMFVGIYLDADKKIPMLSRDSNRRLLRCGVFAAIGVVQSIILGIIVRYGLGLEINHPVNYYFACVLSTLVFISIVEFFIVCLKDVGKFLSILFLILQLTSCGGTFPMEVVPKFFNVLYPFMPMTYTVNLFREAISGNGQAAAAGPVTILVAIGLGFTLLTIFMTVWNRKKEKRDGAVLEAASCDY